MYRKGVLGAALHVGRSLWSIIGRRDRQGVIGRALKVPPLHVGRYWWSILGRRWGIKRADVIGGKLHVGRHWWGIVGRYDR